MTDSGLTGRTRFTFANVDREGAKPLTADRFEADCGDFPAPGPAAGEPGSYWVRDVYDDGLIFEIGPDGLARARVPAGWWGHPASR